MKFDTNAYTGTAFKISQNHLLTAAHNIVTKVPGPKNKKEYAKHISFVIKNEKYDVTGFWINEKYF